jgi:hypothetical protein
VNPYVHTINDSKKYKKMLNPIGIKQIIATVCLCLIFAGCKSYPPYRYSFSLFESLDETLSFQDDEVHFKFVPSSENIHMTIKNKTDQKIDLVRDKAEYIDISGNSHMIHYGYDYVQEVLNYEQNNRYVPIISIDQDSEITGDIWINIWPKFNLGRDRHTINSNQIYYLRDPFFPRHSFEGDGQALIDSTFNLILPIDFGDYIRNYTFTFMINDVK